MSKWLDWTRSFELAAFIAMVTYGVLSFALTPEFPFAAVDMYATVMHRYEGATPIVLFDGEEVDVESLTDFRGVGPEQIVADQMPCSEAYLVDAIRNRIASHPAPGQSPPGRAFAFAWRRYHMEEDGTIVQMPLVIAATGTAQRVP